MILIYKKEKILKFALALLFLVSTVRANEFCFNNKKPIHLIRYDIKSFLLPDESVKIESHKHCLVVKTRRGREVFVSQMIRSTFPKLIVKSSRSIYEKSHCKLKLKEVILTEKGPKEQISDIVSTEDTDFKVDVGGQLVSFVCKKRGKRISLDLSRNLKNELTTLDLEFGKWLDISSMTKLEDKSYSLMAVE